jgi:hypothetical protein
MMTKGTRFYVYNGTEYIDQTSVPTDYNNYLLRFRVTRGIAGHDDIEGSAPISVQSLKCEHYSDATGYGSAIKNRFEEFVMSVNFGNRKSKGFGSFAVSKIDKKKVDGYDVNAPWILFFKLGTRGNNGFLKEDEAYRDLFVLIGVFWHYLKKTHSRTKQKKSVLLGRHLEAGLPNLNTAPRIPSPIIFKPIIIEKNPAWWQMAIQLLYDKDIIAKACVSGTTTEYDRYIKDVDLDSIENTSQQFLINELMDLSKLSNEELD